MMTCNISSPLRVDLSGGTLDLWPVGTFLQQRSYQFWDKPLLTLNMAIQCKSYVQIKLSAGKGIELIQRREQGDKIWKGEEPSLASDFILERAVIMSFWPLIQHGLLKIITSSEAPQGSGLGGSSSLMVSLVGAMMYLWENPSAHKLEYFKSLDTLKKIAARALYLEAGVLGGMAGNQDHLAAAFGGIQAIEHTMDGPRLHPLPPKIGQRISEHVLYVTFQEEHKSSDENQNLLRKYFQGDSSAFEKISKIAELSLSLYEELKGSCDLKKIGSIWNEDLNCRQSLSSSYLTSSLSKAYDMGRQQGSLGGRVCGAGGGGVLMMLFAEQSQKIKTAQELRNLGFQIPSWGFSPTGIQLDLM